jgi:hypothetical protein
MELLLNLVWILLALPAYWVWRQHASGCAARRLTSLQCMLALGCVLVLLFPVISASDDLHVMRAEMEESATSKRAVRHAPSDRTSAWTNRLQAPPATVAIAEWLFIPEVSRLEISNFAVPSVTRACDSSASRAPPFSFLG